jgi:TonB-dependent starch-binding outer membrane protein SusC
MKDLYFFRTIGGLVLLLLCIAGSTFAQSSLVTGRVISRDDGNALPGVSILEKGTANGTVTDSNGNFSIRVSPTSTLVFSFVGFSPQEIAVNNRSVIDVVLESDITALNEIVVIGYGQQEKKDVTGVVAAVSSENFNRGAIVAPEQLIAGKVAGVQVTANSGEPGGGITVRIRGGTSIGASNDPLYVIDGIPVDNVGFPGGRNPLNFLNPADIETFTVLKDASAAAIYGSRAANGVIIITTKKGQAGGRTSLTYDGFYSAASISRKHQVLNAQQYKDVVTYVNPSRLSMLGTADTNWQDEILQTATGQSHNLTLTGGGENLGYRASLGYLQQDGVIKTSATERTNFALNLNQRLLQNRLFIDANVKLSETKDRYNGGGIGGALSFAPTQPVYDDQSLYGGYFEWSSPLGTKNPLAEINLTKHDGTAYRGLGNIQFDYHLDDLVKGLRANLNLGADVINAQRKFFQPTYLRGQSVASAPGQVDIETTNRMNKLLEYYMNYTREIEGIKSRIDVTAGYSWQDFSVYRSGLTARGLSSNVYGYNNPSVADPERTTIYADPQENRLISFFGRVNYSLHEKYLLTVNLRRDGSARFGESNRWGFFPSAAFAWRLYDEAFFSGITDFFSDLKLRIAYGVNGNQEIGNYQYVPTFSPTNGFAEYPFGDTYVSPIRPTAVDRNIKWEETTSVNAGIDFGLVRGRLNGSIDFYDKRTNDLLFVVNVPAGTVPGDRLLTNIGKVRNTGVELTLDAVAIDKRDLRWNIGFNISTNKNRILALDGSDDPAFQGYETGGITGGTGNQIQILKVGHPINAFRVYRHKKGADGKPLADGVDHNEDGVINDADMYEDVDGDGAVNDRDRVPTKSPNPKFLLGLTSNVNYKKFDLSFTLRGSVGNYAYNNVSSSTGFFNRINEQVPQNVHASVVETNFRSIQLFSDYYLENASFLRMDNLTVGYSISSLQNARIRVYGTVQNLFVLTKYSGIDPEVGRQHDSNNMGIDNNLYPRARTFLAGVNISF